MVPTDGSKPEWNLNGQVLDMTLSLRDPVSAIKAKIAEDTGMPPGKQKLRMETIFFKDSNRSGHDTNPFLIFSFYIMISFTLCLFKSARVLHRETASRKVLNNYGPYHEVKN